MTTPTTDDGSHEAVLTPPPPDPAPPAAEEIAIRVVPQAALAPPGSGGTSASVPQAQAEARPPRTVTGPMLRALRSVSFAERRTLLLAGDAALLLGAFAVVSSALLLRPGANLVAFGAFVVLTWVGACWMLDLYHHSPHEPPASRTRTDQLIAHVVGAAVVSRAALLATLVVGTVAFWHVEWYPVQPKALILEALIGTLVLYAWRLAFFGLFSRTFGKKRVLVVGAGKVAAEVADLVTRHPHLGYHIIGCVEDAPRKRGTQALGVAVLGDYRDLEVLVRRHDVDTLVLEIGASRDSGAVAAIADSLMKGVEIVNVHELYERHFGIVPLRAIDDAWFIANLGETHRGLYVNLKRAIDAVCAPIAFLVFAPVLLGVAIAVKLDSPGPALYSQVRVGQRGRPFRIYKFRTMRQDAEAQGAVWATTDDPRITTIGKFLRRTRLDELPQLFNVLRGDISVVGPRPERPEFVEQLKARIPFYDRRHMVKPGLTGWAQVRFTYGSTVEETFEKLQYDLFYLKHRSMLLDLEIILRTVSVVFFRKGAR